MMKLHGYWRSSASYRVRIALGLKGIKVEHIAVNLKAGEQHSDSHAKINAQSLVPVLELEDGTKLTQSIAIIEYLDEVFPDHPLLPHDPILKAKTRAAAHIIAADIAPIQNLRVLKFIRAEHGQDDAGVKAWAAHWITEGFKALEVIAAQNTHTYLYSDTPGLFECLLIPQIYNANRFGVAMMAFPSLLKISKAVETHPAFEAAKPENQHDAQP